MNGIVTTPLHNAVKLGDRPWLERILENKPPLDQLDGWGFAPLHWAVMQEQVALAERLVLAGADPRQPDNAGRLPEELPRAGKEPDLALWLEWNSGRRTFPDTPYGRAFKALEWAALRAGWASGEDVNLRDPMGFSLLHYAVWQKDEMEAIKLVDELLDRGADAGVREFAGRRTPLHLAIDGRGFRRLAGRLVDHDASPGAWLNHADAQGQTPLHYLATWWDDGELRERMEEEYAMQTVRDHEGYTPGDLAALRGRTW